MSTFKRDLNVQKLLDHVDHQPNGAVAALLGNWVVPGQRPHREGKLGLRLAVRNGYLNLYARGQSVAKLTSSDAKLEIETHWKYDRGVEKGQPAVQDGPLYPRYSGARLDELTEDDVRRWAKTAATYANAEKTFVERLVTSNPNVIDLETALPGPTAPRMDLAIVSQGESSLFVGFWEAKCINNHELRASTEQDPNTLEGGPKVIRQARSYTEWLSDPTRRSNVAKAYRATGRILRDLVKGLRSINEERFGHLYRLDGRITGLTDAEPEIAVRPGLVVGTYCPTSWLKGRSKPEADECSFANNLRSYRIGDDGSHEAKVKAHFANYACFDTRGLHELPELVVA